MKPSRFHLLLGLVLILALAPAGRAQQTTPHLGYIYPAGGRQGTSFQITLGGQYLTSMSTVLVSGQGIETRVIAYNRPLTQKEFNDLRDRLTELRKKRFGESPGATPAAPPAIEKGGKGGKKGFGKKGGQFGQFRAMRGMQQEFTPAELREVADILRKLANPPNRQANPFIAESVTLQVTMGTNAEPGQREMRISTPAGLSNPLAFYVGQIPEYREEPPVKEESPLGAGLFAKAKKNISKKKADPAARPERANKTDMMVTLPSVINGQIMPGEVDRYRFMAHKGEKLVAAVSARELIPYLADAVPGWFQATLALYDAQGHEVAYDDDYRFNPDPVLFYQIPADGEYTLEIKDSIYRGREDFVYRITLGQLPFVTGIFPLGGRVGTTTNVALQGWNLPISKLTPQSPEPGVFNLYVNQASRMFNQVLFAVDTLPEVMEREPNDKQEKAQSVTLPVIINGRSDKPGDKDVYKFEGRSGSRIVAEVVARRLNSPLDSVLKLTDSSGKQLAFNDDHADKGAGLTTHQADSLLSTTLPADGTYYLTVKDNENKGGPEYGYRLRISPPQPDFELRVVPSSLNTRVGTATPITVAAIRKDGFTGEIALSLKNAPAGFTLSGARVGAGEEKARLTLTSPPTPQPEPLNLALEGRAIIDGRMVTHLAVPAENMMQAFFYWHLVPEKELKVAVAGKYKTRMSVQVLSPTPVRIPLGGTAQVRLAAPMNTGQGKVDFELSEPPAGISIKSAMPTRMGTMVTLQSDAAKTKPGTQGNLIINMVVERKQGTGKKAQNRRFPMGTLPAIPFDVVER